VSQQLGLVAGSADLRMATQCHTSSRAAVDERALSCSAEAELVADRSKGARVLAETQGS
jgi:hypothetical protein